MSLFAPGYPVRHAQAKMRIDGIGRKKKGWEREARILDMPSRRTSNAQTASLGAVAFLSRTEAGADDSFKDSAAIGSEL